MADDRKLGLVMCHGHAYPIKYDFITDSQIVQWTMVDKMEKYKPDIQANIDLDFDFIGRHKYDIVMSYGCPVTMWMVYKPSGSVTKTLLNTYMYAVIDRLCRIKRYLAADGTVYQGNYFISLLIDYLNMIVRDALIDHNIKILYNDARIIKLMQSDPAIATEFKRIFNKWSDITAVDTKINKFNTYALAEACVKSYFRGNAVVENIINLYTFVILMGTGFSSFSRHPEYPEICIFYSSDKHVIYA